MLCDGKNYDGTEDNTWPKNSEVVRAFSRSGNRTLHCIINSANRELLVVASSCMDAKIISILHGHLQGLDCGWCSNRQLQTYADAGAEDFSMKVATAIEDSEPQTLWSAGYWSNEMSRRAKERVEQLLMRRHS